MALTIIFTGAPAGPHPNKTKLPQTALVGRAFRQNECIFQSLWNWPIGSKVRSHGLFLSDIVRTDGEITIDGFARSVRRDLRDTLTFVPKGVSVEGWSKFKDRRSSVLVFSLNRMPMNARELRVDGLPPRLHFESPSLKQSMRKLEAVMSLFAGARANIR